MTTTRDYVFRLRGDADQLAQAHESAAAAADQHAEQTAGLVRQQAAAKGSGDALATSLARQAAGMHAGGVAAAGFARSGKLSALELQQVGYQLNDLAVQVASGQNPLTALVQQGSQLSGTFGGIRPALAALGSLITPAVVGFGALALGIGAVGLAYAQGEREDRRFRDALVLTGNAAGVTRGSLDSLAATVQATSGITIGAARDIAQGLVETGQVGPGALAAVAQAAATLARVSGKSADEVVKDFAGLANGAAKWALEANKSYNFLTAETYRYIKALEAQGKTEEAMRVAAGALDEALKGRTRELGYLETAWKGVKGAASGAWDAMLNVGRADTSGDAAATLLANLAVARERLALAERRSSTGGGPDVERRRAIVESFEAQLENIRLLQRGEREAAGQSAATAAANRIDLLREQENYQTASAGLQRSGLALTQAQASVAREDELRAVERSHDQGLLSLAGYVQARALLERQGIEAKRAAIEQEIALERKRQPGSEPEALQQKSRITDLLAKRAQLEGERRQLAEQARRNFGKNDNAGPIELAEDNFAKRVEEFATRNQLALDRVEEQQRASAEARRQTNLELGISLIADDERRGQAQIAFEAARLKKQIDLEQLAGEQRKAAEDDVATYIALRQQQLTEQLKPEWQKQLEAWQDTTRLMREAHASFIGGFIQTGEQAWLKFIETGKISLSSFGTLIRDELARLTYRQFVAPAVASVGKSIAGAIGIKLPGAAGGDAGQAAAKAAETAAVTNNTLALTAMQTTGLVPANSALVLLTGSANAASAALAQVAGAGAASGAGGLLGGLGSLFSADGGGFSLGGGGLGSDIGDAGFDLSGFLGGLAKGGAFAGGTAAQRFAKGGEFTNRVITQPTMFRFARGTALGEMGEAGPEGVLPLRRTSRGELGVIAAGGGAAAAPVVEMKVEIINSAPNARVRTEKRSDGGLRVLIEQVESELGARIINGGGLLGPITQRTGTNGGAGLMR